MTLKFIRSALHLSAIAVLAGLPLLATAETQAEHQKKCGLMADLAKRLATDRDNGVPYKEAASTMQRATAGMPTFAHWATETTKSIYTDLRYVPPTNIAQGTFSACLASNI